MLHHTLLPDDSDHLDEECTPETSDKNEEARAVFWQEQTDNENADLCQHCAPKQLIWGISQISGLLSASLSHWEKSSKEKPTVDEIEGGDEENRIRIVNQWGVVQLYQANHMRQ
eukprot:3210446-Ditylum_brightwellii.AAC.1